MFWGLIMEPQKKYTQAVKRPFHISNAALDLSTGTTDKVQVMCGYDNRKYLLCTLDENIYQCPLDLNFDVGTEISFITNGTSNVHLSGYLVQEDEDLFDVDVGEEEEDAEASLGNISASNIVTGKRSKGQAEGQLNGLTGKLSKKLEALSKSAPPSKKLKTMELLQGVGEDDDDSEDDADVHLSDLHSQSDEDVDEDTDLDDEEGDDDDGDEDDDEEEEEDDGDNEEAEDEEDTEIEDEEEEEQELELDQEVFEMAQQNGTVKKAKKEKAKEPKSAGRTVVEGGVQVEELRVGAGAAAKAGKMVRVYYEGRFQKGNKTFDSATKGKGFGFRLGRGEVIKGWDVGVAGMRVGGKRRIVCPPAMAYGARGSPPTIPPNATLVFDVELKHVN